jgi:hypothetical protein
MLVQRKRQLLNGTALSRSVLLDTLFLPRGCELFPVAQQVVTSTEIVSEGPDMQLLIRIRLVCNPQPGALLI